MNSEDAADQILNQVRDMVESTAAQFRFVAGDPSTLVISGYPYSIVGDQAVQFQEEVITEIVDRFTPYWRQLGETLQFFPYDHTITALGKPCYSSPPPVFTLPESRVFFFLEIKVSVSAITRCFGRNFDVTPPVLGSPQSFPQASSIVSAEIKMLSDIPKEKAAKVTNPCAGYPDYPEVPANFYWPGVHLFYVPIAVKPEGKPDEVSLRFLSTTGKYGKDSFGNWVSEAGYYTHYNSGSWNASLIGLFELGPFYGTTNLTVQSNIQPAMGYTVNP